MPAAFKIILNLILFIVYVVVFSLIAGVVIWGYQKITGGNIEAISRGFFDKFQVVFIFVILIVTILLKRYFYLALTPIEEETIVIEEAE